MLSAAHDILSSDEQLNMTNLIINNKTNIEDFNFIDKSFIINNNHTNRFDCNEISTGAILIADIFPGLISKILAPLFVHKLSYRIRVIGVVLGNATSFLVVALTPSHMKWLIFIGVGCASFSASFGKII